MLGLIEQDLLCAGIGLSGGDFNTVKTINITTTHYYIRLMLQILEQLMLVYCLT
jgi:hypothetical protein